MLSIADAGLTYSKDQFDRARFEQVRTVAAELCVGDAIPHAELFPLGEGFPTPKVDVRAVVFRDTELLLVRELADGLWSLPGGWAELGQRPSEAAVREVAEESGYQVRATRLLAVWDRAAHNTGRNFWTTYKLFFDCELTGGEAAPDAEILEVGWFVRDDLPPLSTGRVTADQIARLHELHNDPSAPAAFD